MKRSRRPSMNPPRPPAVAKQPNIAAAWASYEAMVLPPEAPAIQRAECRLAFYGGASTLFYAIMQSLDPGEEATPADLARMDAIGAEITAFADRVLAELAKLRQPPPGTSPPSGGQRLGDAPIEAEYAAKMTAIGQTLDELFNGQVGGAGRETGFVLMVFKLGLLAEGRANFISNGVDRHDVVTLMREMIARFEGQPELSGRA